MCSVWSTLKFNKFMIIFAPLANNEKSESKWQQMANAGKLEAESAKLWCGTNFLSFHFYGYTNCKKRGKKTNREKTNLTFWWNF